MSKYKYLALFLIILVGFVLRVIPALNNGFWFDEVVTFFRSRELPVRGWILGYDPTHPFLYYIFIKWWSSFNTSVLFLRIPSVTFSLLSILLVFKISELLNINKTYGLIASFIFAFSSFQIDHAWQARMYSLLLLFILFSIYFLSLFIIKGKKPIYEFLFLLANVFGFFVDYGFLWYLVALDFTFLSFFIFSRRTALRFPFKGLIFSHLLIFLYAPIFIKGFLPALENVSWIPLPSLEVFLGNILYFFGLDERLGTLAFFQIILLVVSLGIFIYFLIASLKRREVYSFFYLLIFNCFFLPIVISFNLSYLLPSSIFLPRNLIVASLLPPFVLASVISFWLENKSILLRGFGLLILFLTAVFNLNFYSSRISGIYYDRMGGNDYKLAAELIRQKANLENDILIFYPNNMIYGFDYYFLDYYRNNREFGTQDYLALFSREGVWEQNLTRVLGVSTKRFCWVVDPHSSLNQEEFKFISIAKCQKYKFSDSKSSASVYRCKCIPGEISL